MYKSVKIKRDNKSGNITISSKPEVGFIVFFLICFSGLSALPFSEYRNDYFAYFGLLFVLGITVYYFIGSIQKVTFKNETKITVRKGFIAWEIPFDVVSAGFTSYRKSVSKQSLASTHFLSFELQVNLPDNKKYWIRNGKANIFHYGFDQWGKEQERIWADFNEILDKKGIQNLTAK